MAIFLYNSLTIFSGQGAEQGYSLQLVYLGLDSIDESIQRVSKRTELGGHTVPLSTIEINFKHSIRNAISHYKDFDSVMLVDNPVKVENYTRIVFFSEQGKEILREDALPKWAERFIDHVENPLKPLPYADELDEYR